MLKELHIASRAVKRLWQFCACRHFGVTLKCVWLQNRLGCNLAQVESRWLSAVSLLRSKKNNNNRGRVSFLWCKWAQGYPSMRQQRRRHHPMNKNWHQQTLFKAMASNSDIPQKLPNYIYTHPFSLNTRLFLHVGIKIKAKVYSIMYFLSFVP